VSIKWRFPNFVIVLQYIFLRIFLFDISLEFASNRRVDLRHACKNLLSTSLCGEEQSAQKSRLNVLLSISCLLFVDTTLYRDVDDMCAQWRQFCTKRNNANGQKHQKCFGHSHTHTTAISTKLHFSFHNLVFW